ncbi:MAG: chemotaxis protein CheA [Coriobacteriia bacterium]|nr:chemotaxis protein CheA [Coriobacteriia bacterium]
MTDDGLDMQAYRDIFLQESAEYLQSIVDGLIKLEADPDDLEPVEAVFRGAHSLKGMSAAMGYERTADLTHKMESLMSTVRNREQAADGELIDLMLRATDTLRILIDDEMNGRGDVDPAMLVEALAQRATAPTVAVAEPTAVEAAAAAYADGDLILAKIALEDACVLKSVRAYMVIKRLSHMGHVVETHPDARDIEDEKFERSFEVLVRTKQTPEQVADAARSVNEVESATAARVVTSEPSMPAADRDRAFGRAAKAIPKLSETQTVRIAIGHLDNMVDLVGELVIARSRLENLASRLSDRDVHDALEDLHRISADLQHEVMQTRMVPVGNIFSRFPRMVRDLARDLGKDILFDMDGLDIELDRTVLDEIGDPLVHLLRNAIDHGIESAGERAAAAKAARGRVTLSALRERDRVLVSVTDDGRGMDIDRIWMKACEKGIVTPDRRGEFNDEDVLLLTCTSGFSTTDVATKVSGRGVGMDVVRGKIEYLGGSLTIRTRRGEGTEFVLALPLTLAIIQSLLISCGDQVYAVPLGAVTEVFAYGELPVDTVESGPVLTLRDERVVPLYRLDSLIGGSDDPLRPPGPGEHVVLIETGDSARALTVGGMVGRQEIVIKPLSRVFRSVRGLGGATVLGDGSVALILDPRTLFTMADGVR